MLPKIPLGSEYLLCFPYAQHGETERKLYTETIFNFYDKFFPGITIHRKGKVGFNFFLVLSNLKLCLRYTTKSL